MAIEIEKKYRLDAASRGPIVIRLEQHQAVFDGEDNEENIIFSGGILREKHAVLRLRRIGDKTTLTYKERLPSDSSIKHQIEHETEVADFAAAVNIAESLGFSRSLVYEKRRQTWRLNEAEIVLDELPFGLFMEIESTEKTITALEELLQIETLETVDETYPQLTMKYGTRINSVMEARFEQQNL